MGRMFYKSEFNRDISNWNVSSVKDMHRMFSFSKFAGDISNWDVSKVIDLRYMFQGTTDFKCDISKWQLQYKVKTKKLFNKSSQKWKISNFDTWKKWNTPPNIDEEGHYIAEDKDHLKALIDKAIKKHGTNCDLNFINVSKVSDMSGLFNIYNEIGSCILIKSNTIHSTGLSENGIRIGRFY